MRNFFSKILQHRRLVIAFYLIIAIMGIITAQLVSVNYDMKDYLPEGTGSSISMDVMQEQYDSGIPR